MKLFDMTTEAYNTYKTTVKNNQDITFDQARRKITRNILMSTTAPDRRKDKTLYLYGQLEILTKGNLVVWINNRKDIKHVKFHKDVERYEKLNMLLGITEDGKELGKLKKWFVDARLSFVRV